MKRIGWLLVVLAALAGCDGEESESARSMERIHREDGVPVRVREVRTERFAATLTYTATLRGSEESVVAALVSDEVQEVLVAVGDYVERDEVLIRFPTDNPTLGYEQARVNFQNAEESYNRMSRLFNENGVSRQDHDNAKAAYEVARANWIAARDMVEARAPISGYVTRLNVGPADNVDPGDPLVTISNYDRLEAKIWVPDTDIDRLAVGLPAQAHWRGRTLSGRVTQVDLAMDAGRQAFLAVVQLDNRSRLLRSGVTADIEVETYVNESAVVVHRAEMVEDGEGVAVFVAESGRAVKKSVVPGREQGVMVEITDGLRPGERQIIQGIELVDDGTPVRPMEE